MLLYLTIHTCILDLVQEEIQRKCSVVDGFSDPCSFLDEFIHDLSCVYIKSVREKHIGRTLAEI